MSETADGNTAERSDTNSAATNGDSGRPREPARNAPSLILAIAFLIAGVLVAGYAQYRAPDFDYQNANILSIIVLVLATLLFLFQMFRRTLFQGHPWRVPLTTVAVIAVVCVLFEFDGFSGEMMPQIKWRFWSADVPAMRSAPAPETTAEATPDGQPVASADQVTQAASPQFLGPNRNGVYDRRHFSIPESTDQVEVVWRLGVGEGWGSFAVDHGIAVTLEQRGDDECLVGYRLTDGEPLWIRRHTGRHHHPLGGTGPRSTPTIDGPHVFATTATGWLWCVDWASGETVWTRDLLDQAGWDQEAFETAAPWGYSVSPLVVDDLVVVALGGPDGGEDSASLLALDRSTGQPVWTGGQDQLSYASPILTTLAGKRQIVSVNEDTVTGHNPADGTVWWRFDWPGSTNTGANCSSALPVAGDRILVGKGYSGGSALVAVSRQGNEWKTTDQWRSHRVLKTKFNHTCVQGTVGYGISNGAVQAVDLEGPEQLWLQPRRSRAGQGQAVLVEDTLVVQHESGEVVFAAAGTETYRELFRLPALESKTWNIPTVAGCYLLVRNDRQAICFRLPQRTK